MLSLVVATTRSLRHTMNFVTQYNPAPWRRRLPGSGSSTMAPERGFFRKLRLSVVSWRDAFPIISSQLSEEHAHCASLPGHRRCTSPSGILCALPVEEVMVHGSAGGSTGACCRAAWRQWRQTEPKQTRSAREGSRRRTSPARSTGRSDHKDEHMLASGGRGATGALALLGLAAMIRLINATQKPNVLLYMGIISSSRIYAGQQPDRVGLQESSASFHPGRIRQGTNSRVLHAPRLKLKHSYRQGC
jgi:hypothetical protein